MTATMASPRDTARVEHLSMWNQLSAPLLGNPALHGTAYDMSYSEMALTMTFSTNQKPLSRRKVRDMCWGRWQSTVTCA